MHFHKDHGYAHRAASEITPRAVYAQRRSLLKAFAMGVGGTALAAWAARDAMAQTTRPGKLAALPGARSAVAGAVTLEKLTPYPDVTSYNNFFKSMPAYNWPTCGS